MSLYDFLLDIENIWCELISIDIVMWYLLGDIPRFPEGYFDIFPHGKSPISVFFYVFWLLWGSLSKSEYTTVDIG